MSGFTVKTIDQCILEARQLVNDSLPPYRNTDETLIGYLNSGLLLTYSLRPDCAIGNFTQGILTDNQITQYTVSDLQMIDGVANPTPPVPATPFPFDQRQFFNPMVAYITGRIEASDDEYTDTSRSQQFLAAFSAQLTGH